MTSCAGIVLAAGEGRRMGRSKQMLPYGGGTMLSQCLLQARAAGFERLIVVVGARAQEVQASLSSETDLEFVTNLEWQLGMGSSIVAGVNRLQSHGIQPEAMAILLSDQPLIRADQLSRMRAKLHGSAADIVAAHYAGTLGVPAIFKARVFGYLSQLSPAEGARKLLRNSGLHVEPFDLPEAAVDVDTLEHFEKLNLLSGK